MIYSKGIPMGEERTFQFAKNIRIFVKKLPKTIANIEDGKQITKSIRCYWCQSMKPMN
ncbi:MAG: hypothetical protein ISS16_03070 [Ignavibacteria bacterium]|nr:hypothetical protein [Ignavibacteria bacterium]